MVKLLFVYQIPVSEAVHGSSGRGVEVSGWLQILQA